MQILAGLMDIISKTSDDDDECNGCCINNNIITKEEEEEEVVVVAEDLILEILFRLPLFSVFRFRLVCKSWYSLIFNPADDFWFLKHHHHQKRHLHDHVDIFLINNNMVNKNVYRRRNRVALALAPAPAEYVLIPPQHLNQNQEQLKVFVEDALSVFIPQKYSSSCRLIDSCNGLLLYRNKNIMYSTQYHVFNPITKQCFELPMIDSFGNNFRKGTIRWIHIVFDPSVSLSFKVLLLWFDPDHPIDYSGIYVYSSSSSETSSSSSSSWKYLTKFRPWKYSHFRTVLMNGLLYLYKSPYVLLCFDVVKDKIYFLPLPLRKMELPKIFGAREYVHGCGDLNLLYFGALGGRLRLIRKCCRDNELKFSILELVANRNRKRKRKRKREIGDGDDNPKNKKIFKWIVKHRVVIDDVNYNKDMAAQIINIYKTGAQKKGEEALLFLNKDRNTVISYNLTSKTFGEEQKISNVDHHSHDLDAFRFTPTLFTFLC